MWFSFRQVSAQFSRAQELLSALAPVMVEPEKERAWAAVLVQGP